MKILCVSDEKDPLVYSNKLKTRFKEIELVIGCGDLSIDYYEFIVSILNKPLLFVYGNHNFKGFRFFKKGHTDLRYSLSDIFKYDKRGFGSTYIDGKVIKEQGFIFAGLGGSMRYNKGQNQYSEFAMLRRMIRMIPKLLLNKLIYKKYIDVLVTHAPPRGIHDKKDRCHKGFKVFLWFMKTFKPSFLIHGHVHLYDRRKTRRTKFMETEIVNAYGHIVLDI